VLDIAGDNEQGLSRVAQHVEQWSKDVTVTARDQIGADMFSDDHFPDPRIAPNGPEEKFK
jgi:hypothetical protein